MNQTPTVDTLHRIVEAACRAPSMHNAQPWAWRATDGRIDLYADRTRSLPAADPRDRNLVIGCGAALHHARVAAAAHGWSAQVTRLPGPPDHLAALTFTPAAVTEEARRLDRAREDRRTDRRRFSSWPVPDERLGQLAATARPFGVHAVALHEPGHRRQLEDLMGRAATAQADDDRIAEEQLVWIDRTREDGIPLVAVPRLLGTPASHRSRFGAGLLSQPDRELENRDGALVLGGPADDEECWLRAGEALSAIWLAAVSHGLSAVPLTQVVEVDETRRELQEALGGLLPYLVLRVGWQHSARILAPTPRRPLSDVLLPT